MYHRFSCAINGQCESNAEGEYQSLFQCRQQCQPHPLVPDLADITYEYAPGAALGLLPRDQVRIVKKLTGMKVLPTEASRVLQALEDFPTRGVAIIDEVLIWPYIRPIFSPEVFEDALYDAGTNESFAELRRTIPHDRIDYKRVFMAAMQRGNCSLAREIEDTPGIFIDLENEEISDLESIPQQCVLEYLLDVYGNEYYRPQDYFMEGVAAQGDVDYALRLLQLPNVEYDAVMYTAARVGGLAFMQELAAEYYYQSLEQAALFGAPFIYLALENYENDPSQGEIYAILGNVQDQESVDLLFSLLRDPYEPTINTVAQGIRKGLGSLVAPASDDMVADAKVALANNERDELEYRK